MTSNISQSYPYSSETEAARSAAVAAAIAANEGLAATIEAESVGVDARDRWWTWFHARCGGILHAAGYARERHALLVVCDRCSKTALR